MEDVIDEFVEEINEEDELEHQIVERQLVEGQPVEVQQQDGQLAQGQLGEGQMVEEKTRRKRGRIDDPSKNDNSTKNAPKRRKRRETKNVEGQVNKPRQSEKNTSILPTLRNKLRKTLGRSPRTLTTLKLSKRLPGVACQGEHSKIVAISKHIASQRN